MVRCTIFQFIVLLVTWRNNTVLGVTLSVAETTCVGNNITLKCSVNSFTSATWSRNGSTALSTCTSSAFCTTDDTTINGIKYSFTGNPSGTQVSFQLQLVENGIEWVCNFNAIPYVYKFDVSEECLISATPSSATTVEIESSFLEVTESILMSDVILSFESTDVMLEPTTAITPYALSFEDSVSSTLNPSLPLSTNESLEPTELPNSEYITTEKEVDSTLFSLQTYNFTTETIKSSLFNEDISTAMINSIGINLPMSSASILKLNTEISLQDDTTNSPDFYSTTREINLDTQTHNTAFFSSVLLYTKTLNVQTDLFQSTLTARHDTQSISTFSLQPSLDSFIVSSVRQDESVDTFSLSIETSPVSPVLPVYTSSDNRIHTSLYQWSVSQTEFVLLNSSTSDSFTSFDSSASVFESISSSVGQNYWSVGSFLPFETFLMASFTYSSSLSQVQSVYTSFGQTLLLFDLSSVRQTVESTDISFNKIVLSSESSSINSITSFADTLTFQYTDRSVNESISSMVDQSLHLSSLNKLVAVSSETFDGNSQILQFTGTSLSNQPELTTTGSVNHFTQSELTTTGSVNHFTQSELTTTSSVKYLTQSDLLSETLTQVNPSVSKSSHVVEVNCVQSADSCAKSTNVLSVDIFTLQQTDQTLPLSTYSSIKYVYSSTTEQPFNTSLNQFPEGTTQPFGTSSVSMKLSTVVGSTTFHDVSLLSPSSSLIFDSFTEFSSFSKIISTNINNVVTSNINSIESSDTFYVFSSSPTFRPTQTPELSFREAQIIIMSCSFAAVIFVVFVSLMVMNYLRKLPRGNIQNKIYENSEVDGLSSFGYPRIFNKYNVNNYPNMGKNLPLRYHSRSLSDSLYTCDFENNWNSLTC